MTKIKRIKMRTKEELTKVLELHKKWLDGEVGGVRADLSGADLRCVDFGGADLSYSDLKETDLAGADLTNADLIYADLSYSDLSYSNLTNADLYRADLYRANLGGTDLKGANLRFADLTGVNLRGAKNYYSFVAYDTSKRTVHCVKHKDTWMIQAGCFWGTLEELEAKVKKTHNSKVYLANVEILKGLI